MERVPCVFDYKSCIISATAREAGGPFFPVAARCHLRPEEVSSDYRKYLSEDVESFRTPNEAVVCALNWAIGPIDENYPSDVLAGSHQSVRGSKLQCRARLTDSKSQVLP